MLRMPIQDSRRQNLMKRLTSNSTDTRAMVAVVVFYVAFVVGVDIYDEIFFELM